MKSVVVLGGRSGTSVVAGMLHILGVPMGENMRAADATNPAGYYENMEFVKLTSDLIEATGNKVFEGQDAKNTTLGHLMNVRDTVWRNEREPVWGFKAPGTVFVLPLYELFLRNPHYIVCRRNPVEVGRSMEKMGHILPKTMESWTQVGERIQNAMITNTQGKTKLVIDFDDLMTDPTEVVDQIIEFLEFKVDEKVRAGAIGLVNPAQRHERSDNE